MEPRRSLQAERLLVKAGVFQQRCGSCRNFNYEKGQALLASNYTFRRVASVLSLQQMMKVAQGDVRPDPDCPSEVAVDKEALNPDPAIFDPPQATNQFNDVGYCRKYEVGETKFKTFVLDENKNKIPCPYWK